MGWTIEDGEVVDAECDVCGDMDDPSVMAEADGQVLCWSCARDEGHFDPETPLDELDEDDPDEADNEF